MRQEPPELLYHPCHHAHDDPLWRGESLVDAHLSRGKRHLRHVLELGSVELPEADLPRADLYLRLRKSKFAVAVALANAGLEKV